MDRETPSSRWGGLAPGWLDAPPSAEGWLAAPPPLDGWLDAPRSEIARGGLHAQSAVSVTCNRMNSGLQPYVQRGCNRMYRRLLP